MGTMADGRPADYAIDVLEKAAEEASGYMNKGVEKERADYVRVLIILNAAKGLTPKEAVRRLKRVPPK